VTCGCPLSGDAFGSSVAENAVRCAPLSKPLLLSIMAILLLGVPNVLACCCGPRAICSQQVQVRYGRARLLPALSALGCDCVAAEELAQKGGGQPDESVVQHGGWQGRVAPWQDRKKRREAQAQAQVQDNGGMRDA
jgi:hypothetical protein